MSTNPEEGKSPVEIKMEEVPSELGPSESGPDLSGSAVARVEQPATNVTAASPAPSSASSGGRPPYIPQFSASTQMILQRINGRSGGLSSALTSVSAVAKTIEQSTFEDAKRRLVMNMNTSLTMPLPTPRTPSNLATPSASLPINDAFQLRTPSVAKPTASKGNPKVPAKRGRLSRGTKRKRSKGGQDDTSSLSDVPHSDGEHASKGQVAPTMTKSGRQVQKPAQFNPTSPATAAAATQKRRHYGKRTPEQALCKVCTRGLSPLKNQIVFCDGCNLCWHQLCHDPYIDDDFVSNESRSWFCGRCSAKRERHLAKKKSLDGFRGVSWAGRNVEQVSTAPPLLHM